MVAFIDAHRADHGVESICAQLPIAPSQYYAHKAREAKPEHLPPRLQRDRKLVHEIRRIYEENFRVYGARKVWRQLGREGFPVARCTVERLMRDLGLQGVMRGRKRRTTFSDDRAQRPLDRVNRQFQASRPNELWVADHLRRDLVWLRLRRFRHRCVRAAHHRLARGALDAHRAGPGRAGTSAVGTCRR